MDNNKQQAGEGNLNIADYYDKHADLEKQVAERLSRSLEPWQYSIPDGPIIEVGAGTGFFSSHLVRMYPGRSVLLTDISGEMLEKCKTAIPKNDNVQFKLQDAETAEWADSSCALIAGNFVAHYFRDPSVTLSKMMQALKPGGMMLMSFPASESYPNWKSYCLKLGLPFTGKALPDLEKIIVNLSMGPVKVDYYEDQSSETYQDLFEFFGHMEKLGNTVPPEKNNLTSKQIHLLNDYWLSQNNGKIVVHYHTAFVAVKRDLE